MCMKFPGNTGYPLLAVLLCLAWSGVGRADPTGTSICDLPEYRGTDAYNRYCGGSGGPRGSAAPAPSGPNPQQQLIQQGVAIGAYAIGQELHKAMFGDPASDAARQAAEAARVAEQKRRDEEAARRAEEAKQRLLGESKGSDPNSLSLMGVEPAPDLQLMTGDDSLSVSTRPNPSNNNAPGGSLNHSAAFNLGFQDASQCISQNAGPRCAGVAADQMQACLSDYRSGYQVGDKQRQQALDEAVRVGQLAGTSGKLAEAASDPRALGPCRTQWIESYNRGYFKGKQTTAQH